MPAPSFLYSSFEGSSPDDYRRWNHILSLPLQKPKTQAFMRETLSGLTVALAQVPEAVAFAFTAGVDPIVGLQAAWIMCLITALGGGAPGMVSGATGAVAVILPDFVKEHGFGFLFVAIMLMGVIQMFFGLIGAGKLVKLIGAPTMIGFVNGLAIVIFLAQFHTFKEETCNHNESIPEDEIVRETFDPFQGCWLGGDVIAWELFLIAITMGVIYFLPKFTKLIPASLAGILIATAVEFALIRNVGYETPLVEDLASVKGTFPLPIWLDSKYGDAELSRFQIPSLVEWETYRICLPTSLTLAVIGLVESLLTLQLVSEITKRPGRPKAECIAQGFANLVTGMFGGMGGCAMIGQSMINVKSGGITRISSTVSAIVLLLIILVAYKLINIIPVAGLTGVMFMVVIGTFDWNSLSLIVNSAMPARMRHHEKVGWHTKVKRTDVLIIIVVTIVAVIINLAVAVAAGVVLATLFFSWDQGDVFTVTEVPTPGPEANDSLDKDGKIKTYKVFGALFFATSQAFESSFNSKTDAATKGLEAVVVDMSSATIADFSAIAAVNKVATSYQENGLEFTLRGVQPKCMSILKKAKHLVFTHDKEKEAHENDSELEKLTMDVSKYYSAVHVRGHDDGEFHLSKKEDGTTHDQPIDNDSNSSSSAKEDPLTKA